MVKQRLTNILYEAKINTLLIMMVNLLPSNHLYISARHADVRRAFRYEIYFSENFGKYIAVSQTAPHIYTLRLPDGDNIYTYQNGKCIQVEVQTTLATIYIRPRQ